MAYRKKHANKYNRPWGGRRGLSRKKKFKRIREKLLSDKQNTISKDSPSEIENSTFQSEKDSDNLSNYNNNGDCLEIHENKNINSSEYTLNADSCSEIEDSFDASLGVGSKSMTNKKLRSILESYKDEDQSNTNFKQLSQKQCITFFQNTKNIIETASIDQIKSPIKESIEQVQRQLIEKAKPITTFELLKILDPDGEDSDQVLEGLVFDDSEPLKNDSQASEAEDKKAFVPHRSIVYMDYFLEKFLEAAEDHTKDSQCAPYKMRLIDTTNRGMKTKYTIECTECKYTMNIWSEDETSEHMDINSSSVAGAITSGIGYSQMEEFYAAIDVPCMSETTYARYQELMIEAFIKSAQESMRIAGEMEALLARQRGDVKNGIPVTKVVTDGTYMKRTYVRSKYNSISGMAIIVGYYTQQILYMGVRNKFCSTCYSAEKKHKEPVKHKCYKNFDGNKCSSCIETEVISEGFRHSIEQHGLIYEHLIADGDSNVYNRILQDDPYENYNITVIKIECTNHLLRNMSTHLKNVGKGKKNVSKLKKLVENNILRIRNAIKKAVQYRVKQCISEEEKVSELRKDIYNLPFHIFGEHENCASYFCKGPKEGEINHIREMEQTGILAEVEEALTRITTNCRSLLHQLDNNIVEHCNSVLAKIIGGKRINWGLRGSYECRCNASVTQCNSQKTLSQVAVHLGKTPNSLVTKMENTKIMDNKMKKVYYHMNKIFQEPKLLDEDSIKVENKDKFYGIDCEKPDLDPVEYSARYKVIHSKLVEKQAKRHEIELQTRGQCNNQSWFEIKKYMLTASKFKLVCRRRKTTPCANLVKQLLFPNRKTNQAQAYGIGMEKKAKSTYEKLYDIKIQDCGLFIDSEIPYLGATPDGLLENNGLIEIKCPFSAKNMTIEEGIKLEKGELKNLLVAGSSVINRKHGYFYQIQGQLHIANKDYCYLFLWTPLSSQRIKILRDDKFWETEMLPFLTRFYEDCLLPEIVDSRIKRQMPIREPHLVSTDLQDKEHTQALKRKCTDNHKPLQKKIKIQSRTQLNTEQKQRKNSAQCLKQLENGLFNNYTYYMQDGPMVFTVSRYHCMEIESFTGFHEKILWSEDFFTLKPNEWLCGAIMDIFMMINWKRTWQSNNTMFIPAEMTNFIFGDRSGMDKSRKWHMYNIKCNFTGRIFLPYCRNNHWCLVLLDVEKEEFYHVNPKECREKSEQIYEKEIFGLFKKYLEECKMYEKNNLCSIKWKHSKFLEPRPKQMKTDSVNCGPYIMKYMHCFGSKMQMPTLFDPAQYRIELANDLLSSSEKMQEVCLVCINTSLPQSHERITCLKCSRWVHGRCLIQRRRIDEVRVEEFSVISSEKICLFCTGW